MGRSMPYKAVTPSVSQNDVAGILPILDCSGTLGSLRASLGRTSEGRLLTHSSS